MSTANRLVASAEALFLYMRLTIGIVFGIQIRWGRMIRGARMKIAERRRREKEKTMPGAGGRERSLTPALSICRSTRLSRDNGTCAMAQ